MSSATTSQTIFFAPEIIDEDEATVAPEFVLDAEFDLDFDELTAPAASDCDCGGPGGQVAPAPDRAAAASITEAAQQQVKVPLFQMRNWPEFKVDMEKKCRKVLGRRVCIDVPHAFQRTCQMNAFAEVSHPSAEAMRADIISCVRQAVAAGAVAGVLAGNVPAAIAALKASLTACLAAKGMSQLNKLSVNIRTETSCGSWKPR